VIVETRDKEAIVIANLDEEEYENSDDGDVMSMAARSLTQKEDQLAAEAAAFQSAKQPILKDNDLKDVLFKWNREFNFNVTDLYKINLASVFAKEYNEMNKLMNENLVEDTDVFARSKGMAEGFEPRDSEKADSDMAVEATEVMSQQVLPPPSSTPPPVSMPRVRPNSQQRFPTFQYTYQRRMPLMRQPLPGPPMFHRSDTGSPHTFLPKTASDLRKPEVRPRPAVYQTVTGQPMIIHSDGSSMRSPASVRQPPALAAPRIRRPQSTTTPPSGRFGDRFANRLPRPFQRILNMTMGSRPTSTEPPKTYVSSSVAHLPAPSVSHPARVRAPYYLQQTYQNSIPVNARNRPSIATTTTSRPRVTTEPSRTEFGARIRPSRIEKQRNSTNGMSKEEKKEQRDVKISQIRSNLVGKLVVVQSMLDEKEKRSKPVESRVSNTPYKRLPGGLLKAIVPLRLRTNAATTVAPVTTTEGEEVVSTEPTIVWKDKKKYRRPPSFRKKTPEILGEKLKEVTEPQSEFKDVTTDAVISNVTETSVYEELNSTRPADVNETTTVMDDKESTTESIAASIENVSSLMNSTETTAKATQVNSKATSTSAPDVSVPSVEASLSNTTEAAANLPTETKVEEASSSVPDVLTSPAEAVPTSTTMAGTTNNETSTPAAASSEEITSSGITRQLNLDISTEARINGEDALSTPRPIPAPQTVPTPVQMGATEEQPTNRQEAKAVHIEYSSLAGNTTGTFPAAINSTLRIEINPPESVVTVPEILPVPSVENTTENENNRTYAPENDPYLKAIIERALQLSKEEKPEDIQGNLNFPEDDPLEPLEEVPRGFFRDLIRETEEDYPKEDDIAYAEGVLSADFGTEGHPNKAVLSSDTRRQNDSNRDNDETESSFDLPDATRDPVDNEDEGLPDIESVRLRVDRSAEVNTVMHPKPAAAIQLARGGVKPINLPYNILPNEPDILYESQRTEDRRNNTSEMQAGKREITIPQSPHPILPVQRNPSLAGFMKKVYSRFRS